MSDDTPILSLPMILPAQAQKHVTHNEALRVLDVVVQLAVLDRTRSEPPAGPADGDRHIVASGASGDWAGKAGQIAAFWGGSWLFLAPNAGWMARVLAEDMTVTWSAGQWVDAVAPTTQTPQLGINATADTTNRLAVASDASLFSHAGQGHRLTVNKSAVSETASLVFQSDWQGRAEMGLAGSDAFAVKVSVNGAQWHEALVADPATGGVTFGKPLQLGGQAEDPAAPPNGRIWLNNTTGEVKVATGGIVQRIGLADGPRGDVTVSANGTVWTVAPDSIGNAKLAPMTGPAFKGRVTGSGSPQDLTPAQMRMALDLAPLSLSDFCSVARIASNASIAGPFLAAAIGSGTNSSAIPAAAITGFQPSGVFLRSSTTANSGFRYGTTVSSDCFGTYSRKFRAKCLWRATAGNTVRLGFHNCNTATDTNHGAYFEVLGDQITAKTAAASVRTTHPTTLTLTPNTVYAFDIEADAPLSGVRFRVWDMSGGAALMDVTLQTTLPSGSTAPFAASVIATNAGTVASDMIILYEIAFGTIAGFRRALD